MKPVTNVVIAGLGGQGVLRASDVVSEAVFRAGYDVKKSEVHGMSQRGGSVCSDVRFGDRVLSPMVPPGEADFLVVLAPDQIEPHRWLLRADGILIQPACVDPARLLNRKSFNITLLGVMSNLLELPEAIWPGAIRARFPEKLHEANLQAFAVGRAVNLRQSISYEQASQ
jgi:indolepyruvate ferredoxin oxidoreductase beta subunit